MKVLVLLALIGLVAAQTFQGQVVIRNDPNVVGTITANVFYSFPANRTRFDYTQIGGGIQEFFEFDALVSVRYLVCPGTCQAETIKTGILRLFREGNDQAAGNVAVTDLNGNSRTCSKFNKVNPPAGGVTSIAVDAQNNICQATFANGKRFDFFNIVGLAGNPFSARPANCPQPQCTKKQDIVLVFDESGSIDATSFQREVQFGKDLANTFDFSPNTVGMGLVQFDTSARLTITLTFNKASFLNQMNQVTQNRRSTCIGCGIQLGQQELFSSRGRAQASKTLIVLTDGQNNVNVAQFPQILASAKGAGITLAAIGVAQAVASEINNIASNPSLAFFATDFSKLNTILNGLAVATCDDIQGNPCGAGCKGFCGCNQQCLCPDVCENQDKCVQPFCNANQNGAGCQFPRNVVCNDNNACTVDSCNSQLGCVTSPVTCNDGKKCTTDSCDPKVGCVFLSVDCTPNPPDPCNNFSCSETGPGNGCVSIPNPCDLCLVNNVQCPFIPCKINVCNPANGQCRATDKVCNSNNKCIIDSCNPATDSCVQTAVVCNDNNACTDDSCNPATGCVFTPFDAATRCNDSSVCTTDTCNPSTGCVNTAITCNRTNICKDSVCNSVLGCQESDVDCGAVLSVIDPNKQGNCYIAACDANRPNQANKGRDGCFLSQLPGTTVDRCGFCAAPGSQSPFCFLGLDAGGAAGLGGGVIAAIVIGAVVAAVVAVVSGKKGYDVWVKHRNNMQGAQANPMYEDSGRSGNNPFFEARS